MLNIQLSWLENTHTYIRDTPHPLSKCRCLIFFLISEISPRDNSRSPFLTFFLFCKFWLLWVFLVEHRLSCPEACGALGPGPGINHHPLHWKGFLTTGPPGKSLGAHFFLDPINDLNLLTFCCGQVSLLLETHSWKLPKWVNLESFSKAPATEGLAGWPVGLWKHFHFSLWIRWGIWQAMWSKSPSLMCLSLRIFKTVLFWRHSWPSYPPSRKCGLASKWPV